MFGSLTTELDKISPRFSIRADQIRIIRTPSEFYNTLKVGHHLYGFTRSSNLVKGQDFTG